MSKRTRGARSARNRPGNRPGNRPASAPRPSPGARPAQPAPEADSPGAQSVATATEVAAPTAAPVPNRLSARNAARPSSLLATRAANEYVYVARDLRRIATLAAGMVIVLAVLWVLIDLVQVVNI